MSAFNGSKMRIHFLDFFGKQNVCLGLKKTLLKQIGERTNKPRVRFLFLFYRILLVHFLSLLIQKSTKLGHNVSVQQI